MFYIYYTYTWNNDFDQKVKECATEELLEKELTKVRSSTNNSRIRVLVDRETGVDYKEKFEELYNYVLTGAGIRKVVQENKEAVVK